eukprot:2953738-Pleurochrysis_carterae.AAC.2
MNFPRPGSSANDDSGTGGNNFLIYDTVNHALGASAGAEAGRAYGLALASGAQSGEVGHATTGIQDFFWEAVRERSASTHAMRRQFGKLCM